MPVPPPNLFFLWHQELHGRRIPTPDADCGLPRARFAGADRKPGRRVFDAFCAAAGAAGAGDALEDVYEALKGDASARKAGARLKIEAACGDVSVRDCARAARKSKMKRFLDARRAEQPNFERDQRETAPPTQGKRSRTPSRR